MEEQRTSGAPRNLRMLVAGIVHRVRQSLPTGGYLPDHMWQHRHTGILIFLWLHVIAFVPLGVLTGHGFGHSCREAALVAVAAALAGVRRLGKRACACLATISLITCSALLVHFVHGSIEMHFHFFVVLGIITLYQDWIPFLLAIAYVLVHHGLLGVIDPASVYNHPDAWAHPWRWALIHAAFVLAASTVNIIAWNLNEYRALHDPLTSLPNRAYFLHALDRGLARGAMLRSETALLMLDLDGFKQVNDRYGHQVGDELLVAVAERLRGSVRREDTVARLGGDEYAILLYDMPDATAAQAVAMRLVGVTESAFQVSGIPVHISTSIGVAMGDAVGRPEDLLRHADAALYEAKRQGKRRVTIFADYMEESLLPAPVAPATAPA